MNINGHTPQLRETRSEPKVTHGHGKSSLLTRGKDYSKLLLKGIMDGIEIIT